MRRALLVVALFAVSCGSSPTVPSPNSPQPTATLASGSYLLTVSMATSGTGISACVNGTVSVGGMSCTNDGHSWTLAPR